MNFGLIGVALAFVVLYAIHIPLTWMIARRLSGFKFSFEAKKLISILISMHVLQLGLTFQNESIYAFCFSVAIALAGLIVSIIGLKNRMVFKWPQLMLKKR
jgi:hypothetical protein